MRAPKDIVVLTGSGVSAESGVATFRDADGIWAKYDYREVATPEGFAATPDLVHEFYNMRRTAIAAVNPNAAHMALAKLEQALAERGGRLTLVTQNVDNLHERAGSKNILHMHGELNKAECASCAAVIECAEDLSIDIVCASCNRAGGMRPHVVWFGETPRHVEETADAIMGADLFVSIGTSGSVYPAAGFVAEAHALGVPTMELNLEPSLNADLFTTGRYGLATEVVPGWVEEVLAAS
ncbi:NAD-dependent deacylase [Marinicaulis aureus]|uniref:NAD-dependent protein deacylase n=1 Tax=Hyphococcus aureus TaxID=2666033 RepID=A0ABW1L077_9PROT